MGIKQLFSLLEARAPGCYRVVSLKIYTSQTLAFDASKVLYQFTIATTNARESGVFELTDAEGRPTGHLMGFAYKSLQLLESGVKPVWVFDGIPPEMKKRELRRRRALKEAAKEAETEAKEVGTAEDQLKYHTRAAKVTPEMAEDAKTLLRLMGFPVVTAPAEAEAQCVQLLKEKKVKGVVSDDMDCLTFGAETLIKGAGKKDAEIVELTLSDALKGLQLTMDEFIDMCILCGCDYCDTIGGVGPVNAYKLISEHKTLEKALEALKEENEARVAEGKEPKYTIPAKEDFDYELARELFKAPEVTKDIQDLSFGKPDEAGLREFLIEKKNFGAQKVEGILKRLAEAQKAKPQMSLEAFIGKPVKINPVSAKKKADPKKSTLAKKVKKF